MIPVNKNGILLTMALSLSSILLMCSSGTPIIRSKMEILENVMDGIDPVFRPTALKLIENDVDTAFIGFVLRNPDTKFMEKLLKINVTGFLKKADYSFNTNEKSVRTAKEFYNENLATLKEAEATYGVPAHVITSILFVETKFGKVTGNYHLASCLATVAMVDEPQYIEMNKQVYRDGSYSADSVLLLDSVVTARAHKRANLAFNQLLALKEMQNISPIPIMELKGSYAGAFGWSQFLPSSYMSWAVDGDGDKKVNLFNKSDAIASIANYLKINGWGDSNEQKRAAVYHYNNSNDYVNCVLKLAELVKN